MKKLPKIVRDAIECRLPMWWDMYSSEIVLRVQTGESWNGRVRSQQIWKLYDIGIALERALELLKAGANMDGLNLVVWRDNVNIWRFGWDPDMNPLREQVRQATLDRPWMTANWDEWRYRQSKEANNDEQ